MKLPFDEFVLFVPLEINAGGSEHVDKGAWLPGGRERAGAGKIPPTLVLKMHCPL